MQAGLLQLRQLRHWLKPRSPPPSRAGQVAARPRAASGTSASSQARARGRGPACAALVSLWSQPWRGWAAAASDPFRASGTVVGAPGGGDASHLGGLRGRWRKRSEWRSTSSATRTPEHRSTEPELLAQWLSGIRLAHTTAGLPNQHGRGLLGRPARSRRSRRSAIGDGHEMVLPRLHACDRFRQSARQAACSSGTYNQELVASCT